MFPSLDHVQGENSSFKWVKLGSSGGLHLSLGVIIISIIMSFHSSLVDKAVIMIYGSGVSPRLRFFWQKGIINSSVLRPHVTFEM